MKKEELRIGITLFDSVRNKNVQIELKHFKELFIDEKCFFKRYKPIELNDNLLKEIGFKINYAFKGKNFVKDNFELWKSDYSEFFNYSSGQSEDYNINQPNLDIMYLNELQNIYYCLNQKEL